MAVHHAADAIRRTHGACSCDVIRFFPVLGFVLLPMTAHAQTQPPAETHLPDVNVIATTPLLGSGVDRAKVPARTEVLRVPDLIRTGPASALRALDQNVGSVTLNEAQGNPFQPNLLYRGFEASPLAGNPQGLAVYVNGTRFNQPFGETVNWDLIPSIALDEINVVGSNPAFGLNALGGAISVQLKNGFTYHGGQLELSGGSFGRVELSGQYGQQSGNTSAYVAVTGLNENGWRQHSPSQLRQVYGDIGWRGEAAEVHLSVTGADNVLAGNGTVPVQLLSVDRSAVFTYPDETRNKYLRAVLSGSFDVTETTSVQANVYYSNLSQRTRNGDVAEVESCDGNRTTLCVEDGPGLTDHSGNAIPNFITGSPYAQVFSTFRNGGPYKYLNQTATDTNGYGASVQVTNTDTLFGRSNRFAAGASLDGGETRFAASTLIGGYGLDRGWFGPGIVVDQADASITPVRLHASNQYYGLFATDTLDITERLSATVSGRLNVAQIALTDEIGTALNGNHTYARVNPAAGLTYKLLPNLSVYAGYAEANRAPTPAELACADPSRPCALTNFFVGDPDLKQVVARTFEAGLRGRMEPVEGAALTWHAGLFHTDSSSDIALVASATTGRGFFTNVGNTRRQGVEAGVSLKTAKLQAYVEYAFTDATFRTPFMLNSENNPFADENGQIQVRSGNQIPGVPRHQLKFGADYAVTDAWTVGFTGIASSGRYLVGDEANLNPKTEAYVVFGVNTSYRLTRNLQLFAWIENASNAKYSTFGTFSPVGANTPILQLANASNTRSLSPAAPIGGFGGVRMSF